MLLNNGVVLSDTPVMSEKTKNYLSQFWKLPSKEEVDKEREKYYVTEYKGSWDSLRDKVTEHETSI